jgi:Tol biopolymer transport system component
MNSKKNLTRLTHKGTGRTIWTKSGLFRQGVYPQWSPDHKAVVITYLGPHRWEFLTWREGRQLRRITGLGDYDYSIGMKWSPDSRKLLFRTGGSAASDVGPEGAGPLYFVDLTRGNSLRAKFVHEYVYKMKWHNSKTIAFWPVNYESDKPFSTSVRYKRIP